MSGRLRCPNCGEARMHSLTGRRGRPRHLFGMTYRVRRCQDCGHEVATREEIITEETAKDLLEMIEASAG